MNYVMFQYQISESLNSKYIVSICMQQGVCLNVINVDSPIQVFIIYQLVNIYFIYLFIYYNILKHINLKADHLRY